MKKITNKFVDSLVNNIIETVKPDVAMKRYLKDISFSSGRLIVISVGKASWLMAKSAQEVLNKKIDCGLIITKYGYSLGNIPGFQIYEASHPILDESSFIATQKALEITSNLNGNDDVLFLLSGGASALFESSSLSLDKYQEISQMLINCGANIDEINTIRKRLSNVKGGKFAQHCFPAKVHNYILSDVISDNLSSIGSGPTVNDTTSFAEALRIIDKYNLELDPSILSDTINQLTNVDSTIIGSITQLTNSAVNFLTRVGFKAYIVDNKISCDVNDYFNIINSYALDNQNHQTPLAFIFGGEPTVQVKGHGLGGRNQQLASLAIKTFNNYSKTALICFGSDGTDGPTDAAGGFITNSTLKKCQKYCIDYLSYIENNDCYHLLKRINQLIITGPTNTNVNDCVILLLY